MQGVQIFENRGQIMAVYLDPIQGDKAVPQVCGFRTMEASGNSVVKWGESRRNPLEDVLGNYGRKVRFSELPVSFQETVLDDLVVLH